MQTFSRRSFLYGTGAAFAALSAPGVLRAAAADVTHTLVEVSTPLGRLRGLEADGIRVFRGVPFGEDPYVAERRFLAPLKAKPWTGVLDATKPGAIPLQPDRKTPSMIGGGNALVLNLWAPKEAKNAPVMVWIPGGGSTRCDNNDPRFDGTAFAKNGIVLVTINYRVNVDGFLKLEDGDADNGLRDMILGLEWVRDNIAAFGGDPKCVTVFGQSAGATHITSLLASPKTKGLFRRAILQSPSAIAQWTNEEEARTATKRLADFFGVAPTREGFMSLTNEKLFTFGKFVGSLASDPEWLAFSHGNSALFKPYVDGEVLKARPVDALLAGAAAGVEVMVGCTREEWRNYTVPSGAIDKIGPEATERLVRAMGWDAKLLERYRAAGHGSTPGEIFTRIQGDLIFRMPANRALENLSKAGNKVWAYSFDWKSPVLGKSGKARGAAHSNDVAFVFHTLGSKPALALNGPDAPTALADAMHGAWVRFAKTGNPGWAPFDTNRRMTRLFDVTVKDVSDPWAFEREWIRLP